MVALRTEADEHLAQVFDKLGYEQNFALIDTKLALGYLTVAIAAFLYYLEKKCAFRDTKAVIAGAILLYAAICAVMMYLSRSARYKDNKYVGTKDGKKVTVFALTASVYSPIYDVKIVFDDNYDGTIEGHIEFTKIFDTFGYLNEAEFKAHLESLLEKKNQ